MRIVVVGSGCVGVAGEGRAMDCGVDFLQCLPEAIVSGMTVEKDASIGGDKDQGGERLHAQLAAERRAWPVDEPSAWRLGAELLEGGASGGESLDGVIGQDRDHRDIVRIEGFCGDAEIRHGGFALVTPRGPEMQQQRLVGAEEFF